MLPDYYNELVKAIKERLPKETNLAQELMEILCLGKESVYRRLRGDVSFTFDEVVSLSRHFNISLDSILGECVSNGAMFNLQLLHAHTEMQNYEEMINYYSNIFSYVAKDPGSEFCLASNVLPLVYQPTYESITKYHLSRWLYHNGKLMPPFSLADLEVPPSIFSLQNKLVSSINKIGKVIYIWDSNVLLSLIKEIMYFAGLRVITQEDVKMLKDDLLRLLKYIEALTVNGCSDSGHPVSIYLSELNFDMSYGYAERSGFNISFFRAYSINSIDSQQKIICEEQKKWINSLRRHSTLITQSGETERIKFFKQQQQIINAMTDVENPLSFDMYY